MLFEVMEDLRSFLLLCGLCGRIEQSWQFFITVFLRDVLNFYLDTLDLNVNGNRMSNLDPHCYRMNDSDNNTARSNERYQQIKWTTLRPPVSLPPRYLN